MAEAMFRDLGVSELGPELTGEHGRNRGGLRSLTTYKDTEDKRALLGAKMLTHVDTEAFLIAGHSAALINERALEEEIKTEKFLRKPIEEQMHGLISRIKAQHQKNEEQRRNVQMDKTKISMLQMRIKDLSDVMGSASHRQHKLDGQCREVESQIRYRSRSVQDLECNNELLQGNLDTKIDQIRRHNEEMEETMDTQKRKLDRASVNCIAIVRDCAAEKEVGGPLTEQCEEIGEMEKKLADDMSTFKIMESEARKGLKRCIVNNELSNNELTDQIVVKANVTADMALSLRGANDAAARLRADIADKEKINLTFQLDIHNERENAVDTQKRLGAKDMRVAQLLNELALTKSSNDVLSAKLQHEHGTNKRIAGWTENEAINAERLEANLQALKMAEGHGALRKEELGAEMRRLQNTYDASVVKTRGIQEACHKARFKEGYAKTSLSQTEIELLEVEDKLATVSAQTEKAYQAVKSQEALSSQRLASIAVSIAAITERVEIKGDEVHRVKTRGKVSEEQVREMQQTIEEAAEEAGACYVVQFREHTRLDTINVELQDRYRQIVQHNSIGEEALKSTNGRIEFAEKRMEKLQDAAGQFVKLNQEEITHLELRYKKETVILDALREENNANECRRKQVVGEYDAACHKHRQYVIQLRNFKNESDFVSKQLELQKEKQLDAEKMVDMMASENNRNKEMCDMKNKRCDRAMQKLVDVQGGLTGLKEGLHFAETTILALYHQQKVDNTDIHGLENELRISAEQHAQDQDAVKLKLNELQGELQDKESVIGKLNEFKAKMEATEHEMRERLMQSELENARRAKTYGSLLDQEQQSVSRLRALNERMSKEIMAMRDRQLELDEESRLLESKNAAVAADHEALVSEVYRLDRQSQVSKIATTRLSIKESSQVKVAADLQDDAAELALKQASHQFAERDLKRLIQEVVEDNRILRVQAQAKEREDRALLLMIGKEKMHVDTTGHADASAHAESSFQGLLEGVNAANNAEARHGRTSDL